MGRSRYGMLLPDGFIGSDVSKRWHERCYLCGDICRLKGKNVAGVGRVCDDCFSFILFQGIQIVKQLISSEISEAV